MLKIAICDDDISSANVLEKIVCALPVADIDTDIFSSGKELIRHYLEGQEYQIILLDIEMPSVSGIETALELRKWSKDVVLIFITAYKEYVYQVFESLPFRFLEKPVDSSKLQGVILDAIRYIEDMKQFFFFKKSTVTYQIPSKEIVYFEAANRKINIHTTNGTDSFYGKFRSLMDRLDSNYFVQIHTSFIVNMTVITSYNKKEVRINDHTVLPVSAKYEESFRFEHLKFIERRCGKW